MGMGIEYGYLCYFGTLISLKVWWRGEASKDWVFTGRSDDSLKRIYVFGGELGEWGSSGEGGEEKIYHRGCGMGELHSTTLHERDGSTDDFISSTNDDGGGPVYKN